MIRKTRDGVLTDVSSSQDKILGFLYGNTFGRLLLKPLTTPCISKAAGWFLSTKASCVFIKSFIRSNCIDMTQFLPEKYKSYNDFFSRKIRPEVRPIDPDSKHLISPCDSKLTVLPIDENSLFTLKHTAYTVESLLKDPSLARAYQGGTAMIFRLTVDDYHRYCYPCDGSKGDNTRIRGVLHTVMPIANDFFPIYKENSREYTLLRTENFSDILIMEVGALLVGRIVNHHGKAQVLRGQEKGYFQFGGSTVVMLFKANSVAVDDDILANSREGIETVVKMGEKIGSAI